MCLQPMGQIRTQTHTLSQRQDQYQPQLLLTLNRIHPARHLSVSAQLILTDAIRASAGILLTALLPTPSFLQIAALCAAGRRQIFASGLAEQARKAEEAQLELQQPLRHKLSPVLPVIAPRALQGAELCTEAARGCLGHREDIQVATDITACTAAMGGSQGNSSNSRGARPEASHLTYSATPRQGSDSAHRATKFLFST